jgi:MerR family transcriptional regulator, Zn(II)-responsive regulator of zntA
MLDQFSTVKPLGTLHVAELARLADVTPATIRYYARVGLLSPDREPENGYRCFSTADLRRVKFVRQAQALGLTIGNIKAILEKVDRGEAPCRQVRSLVAQRLVRIRKQIADLQATENRVMQAFTSWTIMGDQVPEQGEYCPLIECAELIDKQIIGAPRLPRRTRLQLDRCQHAASNGIARSSMA